MADDLLSCERQHPERIVGVDQLKKPLKAISQAPAQFPFFLKGKTTHGEATVELLVSQDGSVRLPRVVSASAPAFGYAAVQAASVWRFEKPKSRGKPAAVRMRVPFEFNDPVAVSPPSSTKP